MSGPCMCGATDCGACFPGWYDWGGNGEEMTEEEIEEAEERGLRPLPRGMWSRRNTKGGE